MRQPLDIDRARRETRGCEALIHFNNAGASLPPVPVADALYAYLREEELRGGYETMARRSADLEKFYDAAARLLNCTPAEIAFTDSATRAWNTAFYAFDFKPGDRILASRSEYGSNLVALLHQAEKKGVEIVWVPDDESGQIDVDALQQLVDAKARMICLTHIPSGNGLINPAAAVGQIAKSTGIPYLLDACQAIGQLPLDVEQLGCDILCGTGRKYLRAPRGTGLLYVRKSLLNKLEPSQVNHHAAQLLSADRYQLRMDAKRFECWERSCAGQVALGVAIEYALAWGLEAVRQRIATLASELRQKLTCIEGVTVADKGIEQSGIVTFYTDQVAADQLQEQLLERGINTTTVPYSANPIITDTYDYPVLLRTSLHYYNTSQEIERFMVELQGILAD